jgi:hypothetical protein
MAARLYKHQSGKPGFNDVHQQPKVKRTTDRDGRNRYGC